MSQDADENIETNDGMSTCHYVRPVSCFTS